MFKTSISLCGEMWSGERTRQSSLLVRTIKDLPIRAFYYKNVAHDKPKISQIKQFFWKGVNICQEICR